MKWHHLSAVALIVTLNTPAVARAQFVVYTNQATFLAAVTDARVDMFTGFDMINPTPSPIVRMVAPYGYTASVNNGGDFFGAGTVANPWLSTNTATDAITFADFTGGVGAVGGNFFGSNIAGAFQSGDILITYVDAVGATSTTLIAPSTSSFFGVVSQSYAITSFTVSAVQPSESEFLWPTVDNLTLAKTTVPEPGTYALLATGLLAIGITTRRKRALARPSE
ncbi:PEP-CTERM sorting domain-containing protein [Gemmatimonas groenlandica]|uniref:PEP-CTERM sorting domain-containing protein n=1 Tax=Gemmatimonas groenlandica TaxID=2732249 RepID=A0A6M4ISS9_9BACT|nr:PEP-CTERM sorting domain-containing protein [Gemmatimonas groenlandica]QJR37720.1 PEP-CTERM sorting domain-containing protein [Gemmatimonas groenlandica]